MSALLVRSDLCLGMQDGLGFYGSSHYNPANDVLLRLETMTSGEVRVRDQSSLLSRDSYTSRYGVFVASVFQYALTCASDILVVVVAQIDVPSKRILSVRIQRIASAKFHSGCNTHPDSC